MAGTPFATNHASIPTATVIEFDDGLTDSHRCGPIEVVTFAIGTSVDLVSNQLSGVGEVNQVAFLCGS